MITRQQLDDLFGKIAKLRILVFGDIMLDHYIWGDTTRISPEAPVPVVHVHRDTYKLGGAANVAENLKALGASVELAGVIGDDASGKQVQEILQQHGIALSSNAVSSKAPTIVKTRLLVQHQQMCRIDRESIDPAIYAQPAGEVLKSLQECLADFDAIIISDYAKGTVQSAIIQAFREHPQRPFIALDPKPSHEIDISGADLITPNRKEAIELSGISYKPHQPFPAEAICEAIYQKLSPRNLLVTLGAEGMLVSEAGNIKHRIPTVAREVFDVSGAGDTVISAATAACASGHDILEAAQFANLCAGVVVSKVGTATVMPSEVYEAAEELFEGSEA